MPTIEAEFEVWCAVCGSAMCLNCRVDNRSGRGQHVMVKPCEKCLEKARDEGYDKGYDVGLSDGAKTDG
jgi:hypothetical protein